MISESRVTEIFCIADYDPAAQAFMFLMSEKNQYKSLSRIRVIDNLLSIMKDMTIFIF